MKKQSADLRRIFTYAPMGMLFFGAAASQAKLQIFERQSTIDMANKSKRYELSKTDFAHRGGIFTADGQPLAIDKSVFDLNVDFTRCPNIEAFWLQLAQAAEIPATEFEQNVSAGTKTKVWPQALTEDQKKAVDQVRGQWRASGVSAAATGYRAYPLGASTACLVGIDRPKVEEAKAGSKEAERALKEYPNQKQGKTVVLDKLTGLEYNMDSVLRGHDGKTTGVTDRNGRFLPMRVETTSEKREDGKNVTLTLDATLQQYATEQIKAAVQNSNASSGVIVVEDPSTGNILAMANWPSFEPYVPDGGYASLKQSDGLNQAYMSDYEPGSMFKILTLAEALDSGAVKMTDHFYCPGTKVVVHNAKPINCTMEGGHRDHGDITPDEAIAGSCNIAAATWALKIGRGPFLTYLHKLRIFEKPDIGLAGATKALFNHKDGGKELQTAMLGFGQSINCPPVALIGAFSTIANHGVRMQPHLISRIGDTPTPVEPGKSVLRDETCKNVITGMEEVIDTPRGTGRKLKIAGYEIAGKTGTAQKIGGAPGHVSNFVGFVPSTNTKAVILVMIDRPNTQHYYGAELAGPVFGRMARAVIRRFQIPPNEVTGQVAVRSTVPPAMRAPVRVAPAVSASVKKGPDVDVSITAETIPAHSTSQHADNQRLSLAVRKVKRA